MKTKQITISAVLTALSFAFVTFVPTIDLGVWSFTPFSHLFLFLATMLSPFTGIMVYLSTLGAFMLKTGNMLVWLRAASHFSFVALILAFLNKLKINTPFKMVLLGLAAAIAHSVFEMLAVGLGLGVGLNGNGSPFYIFVVLGIGTLGHSLLDYFAAYGLYSLGVRYKILTASKNLPLLQKQKSVSDKQEKQTDVSNDGIDNSKQ